MLLKLKINNTVRDVDVSPKETIFVSPSGELFPAQFGGGKFAEYIAKLSFAENRRITTAGTVTIHTSRDRVYNRNTGAVSVNDGKMNAEFEAFPPSLAWESSNPSIATIDQQGNVTWVSNGTVDFTLTSPDAVMTYRFTAASYVDVVDKFSTFADDSLGEHMSAQVDTRIAGKGRAVARDLYTSFPSNSNYTDAGETRGEVEEYIRNPGFWASDVDLTCISPGHVRAGEVNHRRSPTATLISPIHWISCTHASFHPPVGSKVYFVGMDNSVVHRTTIGKMAVPASDFTIGIFDAELPVTITPVKVLPDNITSYLSKFSDVPGLVLDQQEHGAVHELTSESIWKFPIQSTHPQRYAFVDQAEDNRVWDRTGIELYDSGNPSFVLINGELVLITVWTVGGGGGGSNLRLARANVNATMASLSTTHSKPQYTLTSYDLSGFTTF